jgi:predicted NBD/HSP70 family sugar kinase
MELSETALQLLKELITGESLARPELSRRLSVTAPTVGTGLRELQSAGFVVQTGSHKGALGRTAALYGLSPKAGWVLGVDFGSTKIVISARDLSGTSLGVQQHAAGSVAESDHGPAESLLQAATEQITRLTESFGATHGPLLGVGIALPHVVPNKLNYDTYILWDQKPVQIGSLLERIGIPVGVPVLLENNTNCAALAELAEGRAANSQNFVYLQVGVRIGAGIVSDGRLHRGAHGAGGELALIPFPFGPAQSGDTLTLGLETYVGSESLMQRVRSGWTDPSTAEPSDVKELFALAESGHGISRDFTSRHVLDVARVALNMIAVLDPDMIVLGGGVGQNPLLAAQVRTVVNTINHDINVVPSSLGDRGTAEGAAFLACEFARMRILGERRSSSTIAANRSIVVLPAAEPVSSTVSV